MPVKDIPRISMPSRDEFLRDYAYEREPVVITDLFAGQEVAQIETVEDATSAWGDVKLLVQEEYTSAERAEAPPEPAVMSLREYVDFAGEPVDAALLHGRFTFESIELIEDDQKRPFRFESALMRRLA